MSVALSIPGREGRVELPNEPVLLAREVLRELGVSREVALVGHENDGGWSYGPGEVARMIVALEEVLAALDGVLDAEGQPVRPSTPRLDYFNERQWLRAALAMFRRAATAAASVEASV